MLDYFWYNPVTFYLVVDTERIQNIRLKAENIKKKLERWGLKLRDACYCYGKDVEIGKIFLNFIWLT